MFNNEITFDTEYLQRLNVFQNTLYPMVKAQLQKKIQNTRIQNLNKDRVQPIAVNSDDIVFRKEYWRNKLRPRFSKHRVVRDNKINLISARKQKLHKA